MTAKTFILWQITAILGLAGLFLVTHSPIGALFLLVGAVIGLAGLWLDRQYGVIHTVLFVLILIPLSIFVTSSTGNTIGQGLVSALLLGLFVEMLALYNNPVEFNRNFHVVHKPLTDREIRYSIVGFGIVTAVICSITVL